MTLQPHREILEFWRAVARFSFREGAFVWGGAASSNSVSDAEQLLCILHPATQRPRYRLDVPDRTDDEALESLRLIGDRHSVPLRLIRAQTAYLTRYRAADGTPTFEGGDGAIGALDCVESFAVGLRLSLAAIGFSRVFRSAISDAAASAEAQRLEDLAAVRLTAATVGLLRCFATAAFGEDSPAGRDLYRLIGQQHRDRQAVLDEYRSEMAEVRARILEDVTIGSAPPPEARDLPYVECGWTWGVIAGAPEVEITAQGVAQRPGAAAAVPDPYFTWVAVEAIPELWSPRTRLLGLLDAEQARIAQSLQLRVELTRFYWSRLATFGDHRWPVERLPWPGGGEHSDYASLLVATITTAEVASRVGYTDLVFAYLLRVLARLAARHGIVRPPHAGDPPPAARLDGHRIELRFADPSRAGSHLGPDFAVLLFDVLLRAATATNNEQLRTELTDLAGLAWDHLRDHAGKGPGPRWCNVHRTVVAMITAVDLVDGGAGRAGPPLSFVHKLLADADEAFDALPPTGGDADRENIAARLDRARRIVDQHPARAAALLYQVLGVLDERLERHATDPDGP